MTITVPITFVGDDAKFPNGYNQYPCIEVWVSASKAALSPSSDAKKIKVWALVDTGADLLFVDHALAMELGMTLGGYIDVNDGGHFPYYKGAVMIDGTDTPLDAVLTTHDFVSQSKPYRMVVGRILLNAMRLEYQPTQNKCNLHID